MKLYRLYTEDKNRGLVVDLAAQQFQGFTVYQAQGFWDGRGESSLVLEIYGGADDITRVQALAAEIKSANAQAAVLIVTTEAEGTIV